MSTTCRKPDGTAAYAEPNLRQDSPHQCEERPSPRRAATRTSTLRMLEHAPASARLRSSGWLVPVAVASPAHAHVSARCSARGSVGHISSVLMFKLLCLNLNVAIDACPHSRRLGGFKFPSRALCSMAYYTCIVVIRLGVAMPFHAACNGKFPARAGPQGQDMRHSRSAHRRLAGSSFRPSYSPMNWTPSRSFIEVPCH